MLPRLAIVIGVSAYEDGDNLKNAARDARRFAAFLKSPPGGSFADDEVLLLVDSKASVRRVRVALWRAALGRHSQVVIYFAGHGIARGAWLHGHGDLLRYETLADDLAAVDADHKLLILDTCHAAGALDNFGDVGLLEKYAHVDALGAYLNVLANTVPGLRIIAASSRDRTTPDDPSFTRYLIGAARGATPNEEQVVTAGRAVRLAAKRFKRDLGARYPVPWSRGDLDSYPFALSDAERPFGSLRVFRGAMTIAAGGGGFVQPLGMMVSGRRFLPTRITVELRTSRGTESVGDRWFVPSSRSHRENIAVGLSPLEVVMGREFVVRAWDQRGNPIGGTWRVPLELRLNAA